MTFQVLEVALELVAALRAPVAAIAVRDADLARQLRRAAASVPLNIGEGNQRRGGDRIHHFRIAAGSAAETTTALRVALAWGYTDAASLDSALLLCDRVRAMLWRLTR
jgi:four helix bundle protein